MLTLRRTFLPVLICVFTAVALFAAPGGASAAATPTARLAHKPTGLALTAPKGYTVTYANGFYTVRNKAAFAVFATGGSPLTVQATGAALLKASKGRIVGKAVSSKLAYRATVKVGKRFFVISVRAKAGGMVETSLVGPGAPPAAKKDARLVGLSATQLAQVAALDRIVRSRRGGATALINVQVPMKLAQTADNAARANVPDLPGWTVSGGNGLFAVEHPTQGFGFFGVTIAALTPSFPYARPVDVVATPSSDPAAMLAQVWPQYMTKTFGQQFAFSDMRLVPGTEGILGPTIPSGMYAVRFTYKNIPHQGLFLYGMTNFSESFTQTYFSGIGVADNAPGGISNALLQSWASSSGIVGFRERFSTSLELVAKGENAILTPSRFRQDASTWIDLVQSGASAG